MLYQTLISNTEVGGVSFFGFSGIVNSETVIGLPQLVSNAVLRRDLLTL